MPSVFDDFFTMVNQLQTVPEVKEEEYLKILYELDAITSLIKYEYITALNKIKKKNTSFLMVDGDEYIQLIDFLIPTSIAILLEKLDRIMDEAAQSGQRDKSLGDRIRKKMSDKQDISIEQLKQKDISKEAKEKLEEEIINLNRMDDLQIEMVNALVQVTSAIQHKKKQSDEKTVIQHNIKDYPKAFICRDISISVSKSKTSIASSGVQEASLHDSVDEQTEDKLEIYREVFTNIGDSVDAKVIRDKLNCQRIKRQINFLYPSGYMSADKGFIFTHRTTNELNNFCRIWGQGGRAGFIVGPFEQLINELRDSLNSTKLKELKDFVEDLRSHIATVKKSDPYIEESLYERALHTLSQLSRVIPVIIVKVDQRSKEQVLLKAAQNYTALSADEKKRVNPFSITDKQGQKIGILAVAQAVDLDISNNFSEADEYKIRQAYIAITSEVKEVLVTIPEPDNTILQNKYVAMAVEMRYIGLSEAINKKAGSGAASIPEITAPQLALQKKYEFIQSIVAELSLNPDVKKEKPARMPFLKNQILAEFKKAKFVCPCFVNDVAKKSKTKGYEIFCTTNLNTIDIYFKYNGEQIIKKDLLITINLPEAKLFTEPVLDEEKAIALIVEKMNCEQLDTLMSTQNKNMPSSSSAAFSLVPTSTVVSYPEYNYLKPSELTKRINKLSDDYRDHHRFRFSQNRFDLLKEKILDMNKDSDELGREQVHQFFCKLAQDYKQHVWERKHLSKGTHKNKIPPMNEQELTDEQKLTDTDYQQYMIEVRRIPGKHEYMEGIIGLLIESRWIKDNGSIIDHKKNKAAAVASRSGPSSTSSSLSSSSASSPTSSSLSSSSASSPTSSSLSSSSASSPTSSSLSSSSASSPTSSSLSSSSASSPTSSSLSSSSASSPTSSSLSSSRTPSSTSSSLSSSSASSPTSSSLSSRRTPSSTSSSSSSRSVSSSTSPSSSTSSALSPSSFFSSSTSSNASSPVAPTASATSRGLPGLAIRKNKDDPE